MRLLRPTTRHLQGLTAALHTRPARILGSLAAAVLGFAAITGYATALWKAPDWTHATKPQDRYNARILVISTGGSAVVLTGLLYTARNYRLSRRGQVTDRYTKALERLDSPHLYIRTGGIHALEHVMRDSPDHHNDVTEVLTQFTRHHTPNRTHTPSPQPQMHPLPGRNLPGQPRPDIQAALTALAHRPHRPERQPINLTRLHLVGATLTHANLTGAGLDGADLTRAWLNGANLTRARLNDANLTRAWLHDADLTRAILSRADLTGAALSGAELTGASLDGANLTDATLVGANLTDAWLDGANLTDATLADANLTRAWLNDADLTRAWLNDANLTGATLGPDPPVIPEGWIVVDPETGRLGRASGTP